MLRLLGYILFTAILVTFAVVLANDDGTLVINHWMGRSLAMPASLAFVLLLLFLFLFWVATRFAGRVVRLPASWLGHLRERRLRKAALSLGEGLTAVRGGNTHYAGTMLRTAERQLPDATGIQLLNADLVFARGDYDKATDLYRNLSETVRFHDAGVRGLIEVASAQGDEDTVLFLTRDALARGTSASWVTAPLFQILVRRRLWEEALGVVGRTVRATRSDDPNRHIRAALLCAMARDARKDNTPTLALRYAQQALELDPGMTEASLIAARAFIDDGKPRKAAPIVVAAWKKHPHPELARLYLMIEPGNDTLKRLKRIESLVVDNRDDPQSRLAVAQAALEARMWGQVRRAIEPLVSNNPSPAVCKIVASLEEGENHDLGLANQWLLLALSATPTHGWHCTRCKAVHAHWDPVCQSCGTIGQIVWESLDKPALNSPAEPAALIEAPIPPSAGS